MEVASDYYATLGVDRLADEAAIRSAYRKLMRCTHPDVNPSEDAGSRASAINEAYRCLHDPAQRAAYDGWQRSRHAGRPHRAPPPPLHDFKPTWPAEHLKNFNDDQVIPRRWKLVSVGLAALATIITFTMTSTVDTAATPAADVRGASPP